MPALLPLIAWPLTLGAAVLVFGVSSQGTLGLISDTPAACRCEGGYPHRSAGNHQNARASSSATTPQQVAGRVSRTECRPVNDRRRNVTTAGQQFQRADHAGQYARPHRAVTSF